MSSVPLHYSRDLLSPSDMQLLRHAHVIDLGEEEVTDVLAFELDELPG